MDELMRLPRLFRASAGLALLLLAAGCSTPPPSGADVGASPWASQSVLATAPPGVRWKHHPLPGKTQNEFRYVRKDDRHALAVRSESSASLMRYAVRISPQDLGKVRFSWNVPALMAEADLALRTKDDASVRVILAFDGDRTRMSGRDLALSELARAITGEELPYATLMYVWSMRRAAGAIVHSPRTDRIRSLVVESGEGRLNRWLDYERDIRADYQRVFGEKPGALIGIALMTDSDNTQSSTSAWYGPVRFVAAHSPAE